MTRERLDVAGQRVNQPSTRKRSLTRAIPANDDTSRLATWAVRNKWPDKTMPLIKTLLRGARQCQTILVHRLARHLLINVSQWRAHLSSSLRRSVFFEFDAKQRLTFLKFIFAISRLKKIPRINLFWVAFSNDDDCFRIRPRIWTHHAAPLDANRTVSCNYAQRGAIRNRTSAIKRKQRWRVAPHPAVRFTASSDVSLIAKLI